jgi:hypothetical protein
MFKYIPINQEAWLSAVLVTFSSFFSSCFRSSRYCGVGFVAGRHLNKKHVSIAQRRFEIDATTRNYKKRGSKIAYT